jgi:acyl-CoA dehydrogenase
MQSLRDEVRRFIQKEVEPRVRWIEEHDEIPDVLLAKAREMGLFGITIPEQYGGSGLDLAGKCAIEEEMGKSSYGFATLIGNHTGISSTGIVTQGNEQQKQKYLPKMASGAWIGCFALTESQAGSDPGALRTAAVKKGDRWILNGEKIYITNAPVAHVFTVMAVTDKTRGIKGISAFIVERGCAGLSIGSNESKMGMRGCTTATVAFNDCVVPVENLLGSEGMGYVQALKTLTQGRVTLAARCVGMMDKLMAQSIAYMKLRSQGGRKLADYQGLQWMLADLAVQRDAARLLVERAVATLMRGERGTLEAAMAKLHATESLAKVVDAAVQIHGGMGYMREAGIESVYRDARITRIYEGTSEIQRNIIAAQLLGDG